MARVRTGNCSVCGADNSYRPLYRCVKCKEVFCTLSFSPDRLREARDEASRTKRGIKPTCETCRVKESYSVDSE